MKKYNLTKYECSHILGLRSAQLSASAPVFVDVPEHLRGNFLYIAAKELINEKLDIQIRRYLPFDEFYEISIKDCTLPDDLYIVEEMLNPQKS